MKYTLAILTLILSLNVNAQLTIDGVTLPATLKSGSTELVLNGGGVREKFFFDLYVGGLYLKAKSTDADVIINANEPMAITFEVISSMITSERMSDAIDEGMENSMNGNTEPLLSEIKAFEDAFSEEINIGDVFLILYTPSEGTVIYKNDKKVKTIKGFEFKKAAFGVWLCDDPADKDLKEGMLQGN